MTELEKRKWRWDKRAKFEMPDRIPVLLGIGTRFWLPIFGISFEDYWSSPRKMMESQLDAIKWIFENVNDDRYGISVGPDFQNVREATGLGCELTFRDGFPWIREPMVKSDADIQRLAQSDMSSQGLTAKMAQYYLEMRRMAKDYKIILTDGSISLKANPGMGTDGPFTNLAWIRGATSLMLDVTKHPEMVHEMMDIVTNKIIEFNHFLRELAEIPKDCGMGLADDFTAFLSPDQYREFVLPYHERFYESFGTKKRAIHLCGKIDHLLELLLNEEKVQNLDGFGWVTSPMRLAKVFGGKALLYGGPSPSLILEGPVERIVNACREYIEIFQRCRGYALGDGYNIAPGTPSSHMNSVMVAAELFGGYGEEEEKR